MNTNTNIKDACERFVVYLKGQKKASATILAYGNDVSQMAKYLESQKAVNVSDITLELLNGFKADLEKKGYIAKSVSRKINSLKTFFRFLKSEGTLQNDPSTGVTHPKYTVKPPRILSKIEYRALRDTCRMDARVFAIVELMLQTGIRIGEVGNLCMEDYKKNEIYIKPFESHNDRTIPLNKPAKEALDRYLSERPNVKEKAIFVTKTGRPFLIRNIRSSIERYFDNSGIKDAKVNDLRHTWVFHHLSAGTPLMTISKLAGHKRLSTTEKYLKLITDFKEGSVRLEEL
jgi:site-specific recombinase XerD